LKIKKIMKMGFVDCTKPLDKEKIWGIGCCFVEIYK
jgi:hypothetical protein